MKKLENKVAVVTGASKGIGAAIAKKLAAEGAAVIVNYASAAKDAERVVAEIVSHGGRAIAMQADVSKTDDIDRLFTETVKQYGAVDILVNNAGIYQWGPIEDVTEEGFYRQFGINVLGPLLATKAAVQYFSDKGGSIINIGSTVVTMNVPGSLIYTSTKYVMDATTRILAKELAPKNIRVNSINAGSTHTEGTVSAGMIGGDPEKFFLANTPLGRTGNVEDIAKVAVFLASGESAWITGELIAASGGLR